jgi:hypothetical protein
MQPLIKGMAGGWSVGFETDQRGPVPVWIGPDGYRKTETDVALSVDAKAVFRSVKKWLDMADDQMGQGAPSQAAWKAMDKAKLALESWMRQLGVWEGDHLLETELDPMMGD